VRDSEIFGLKPTNFSPQKDKTTPHLQNKVYKLYSLRQGMKKNGETSKLTRTTRTFGEKSADNLSKWAGSWAFIIGFAIFLVIWMILNTAVILFGKWDIYPFILLNLVLSCLAAIQAPIILMSQNRQGQKDRKKAEYDYQVNRKAEKEIEQIQEQLNRIEKRLKK